MKKTLKKLLVCILIILIINNFFISNISFAADSFEDWLVDLLGSVVGLLTYPIRIVAIGCGYAIDTLTKGVAESQGSVDANGNIVEGTFINNGMITPFDIFFNKIALIDVNFFNIQNDGSIISNIRTSIAGWYYVMRTIAAAILLCILIYVGIRMAISTIASDKAAYKKMLVDWVCSLALIFLLQYIILFTFAVNEAFIKALSGINDGKDLCDAMVHIKELAMKVFEVNSIAATIVFCMLVAQTLALLISYFNRMLKLAFLVIIAPLITLTYSIDKMGDGKAQALGTWLKEFIYTVLLQSFHCIIYMAFVSMALAIFTKTGASESNNLAGSVLAVLCVKFTKEGEKLLGKIFSFSDSTSDSSIAAGMMMSAAALKHAGSVGKGARTALNGAKNFAGSAKTFARTARVEALAIGAMMHGAKREDGSRMSFEEAKDQADTALTEKEAAKAEAKNAKKYGVKTSDGDYKSKVDAAAKANMAAGMSAGLATAKARAQVAKQTRADKIKTDPKGMKDKATHLWRHNKVRGTINKVKSVASQSETLQKFGELGKKTLSAGMGTFMGGAMFGTGSDLFTATSAGAAMYKGSQEFMKNSSKTLSNEVSNLMKGTGITDIAEAGAHVNEIMQNSDTFENADKEIDDIFKELEKALEGLSDRDKKELRNSIKNVVNSEMTKNPSATNEDIMSKIGENEKIKGILGAHTKAGQEGAVQDSIGDFVNFKRDKSIYDTVKNAGSIGLSPDAFIASSLKQFEREMSAAQMFSDADRKKVDRDIISNAKDGNIGDAEVKRILSEAEDDPAVIRKLEKRMESELADLEARQAENLEFDGKKDPELQAEIENLKKAMNDVSDAALTAARGELEGKREELMAEAERIKTDITKQIEKENEAREAARKTFGSERNDIEMALATLEGERRDLERQQKELEALLANVQSEYKSSVKEAQRFGSSTGIADAQDAYNAIYGKKK